MKLRLAHLQQQNLAILNTIVGLEIQSAIIEQFYFEGQPDEESEGILCLTFSNDKSFTFDCDGDAESLHIQEGTFSDKGTLDKTFTWAYKHYLDEKTFNELGKITKTEIEHFISGDIQIQSGCRISFQSGDFLHIWTIPSDNLFWGINQEPPYYSDEAISTTLLLIKEL